MRPLLHSGGVRGARKGPTLFLCRRNYAAARGFSWYDDCLPPDWVKLSSP